MLRRRSRAALAATVIAVSVLAGLGLWRRLQTVAEYRNFAGDGWQYYHLAENLVHDHRYAFGPPPWPLANTRLPGYPLFVAAVAHGAPRFADGEVALRVTRAQAVLDVLTALVAFLIARELGLRGARFLALALCAASPLLALCTSYILSETLAIFLTTVVVWLLLRAARERLALHLAAAAALCGLGLLVRADTVTLIPCFLVPLALSRAPRRERVRAALLAAAAAAAVFAPWPLRNLHRFGSAHLTGSQWVTHGGDPLPTGAQAWLRTWVVSPEDAAGVAWPMTRATRIEARVFPPDAADSPEERARVVALFDRYDRDGLISPAVDDGLRELARDRRRRDPLRYYFKLPLRRVRELWWHPVPEWELPSTSPTLGLPAGRAGFERLTHRPLLVALAGLLLLLLVPLPRALRPLHAPTETERSPSPSRVLALLALVAALVRTAVIAFAVPGGTQRYNLELLPLLLVLAAVALAAPAELILARLVRAAGR